MALQKTKADSENSWSIDVDKLGEDCDLSVKNPNKPEIIDERTPFDILKNLYELSVDSAKLLHEIAELMKP